VKASIRAKRAASRAIRRRMQWLRRMRREHPGRVALTRGWSYWDDGKTLRFREYTSDGFTLEFIP